MIQKVSPHALLFKAVSKGQISSIESLLKAHPVHADQRKDESGQENLQNDQLDLHFLVHGFNCAHVAARKGRRDILALLLAYDPSLLHSLTEDKRSLFMISAFEDQLETLQYLCKEAVKHSDPMNASMGLHDLSLEDHRGNTALHYSVWGQSLRCTQYLVESANLDFKKKNHDNLTPLQLAAAGNNPAIASYLLSRASSEGDRAEDDISITGMTSLHRAAMYNSLGVMKLLTDSSTHFDINAKTENGNTALHLAAMHGHYDCLVHLIDVCHAEVDPVNHFGLTPLHFACIKYCTTHSPTHPLTHSHSFADTYLHIIYCQSIAECRAVLAGEEIQPLTGHQVDGQSTSYRGFTRQA